MMTFERFCWVMWQANTEECLECGTPFKKVDDYVAQNSEFLTKAYALYLNAEEKISPPRVFGPP